MSKNSETMSDMAAVIKMITYLINTAEELDPPCPELSVALEDALGFAEAYERKTNTG